MDAMRTGSAWERSSGRRPQVRSRLAAAAFDALPSEAAVLDRDGVILVVNEAWRRFGRENGAGSACGAGVDYLSTCQLSAATGDEVAAAVHAALTAVLDGHAPAASLNYPCHSPTERRWFRLTVRLMPDRVRVLVLHDQLTGDPARPSSAGSAPPETSAS